MVTPKNSGWKKKEKRQRKKVRLCSSSAQTTTDRKGQLWDNKVGKAENENRRWLLAVKKMQTLFRREFEDGNVVKVLPEVTAGCEWVLNGEGVATEKVDGACCAIIGGRLYKRFDAKPGRKIPEGAVPCQDEPDPVTGHFPHWVLVDAHNSADRWFVRAWCNTRWANEDGTYEAVGPHFQSNPYGLDEEFLERHGRIKLPDCPRDYIGIREYLRAHNIEGIVWHRGNGEMCKIKRRDFGFEWPVRRGDE